MLETSLRGTLAAIATLLAALGLAVFGLSRIL